MSPMFDDAPVTHISYWVRVSDTAYMEMSPGEIQDLITSGFMPDIRIMEERVTQ